MKRIIIFCITAVLIFSLWSCGSPAKEENDGKKTIGVVAKGESHAFWQSVKAGAEAAAEERGYSITFRGPASESAKDLPSQQEMVQTALSNNVDGLVLATIGEGFADMLTQAFDKGIPVVQFDSGIWEKDIKALEAIGRNPIASTVATSNLLAAGIAAEHFYAELKEDIAESKNYVVGVIQHDETQSGIDRVKGFVDRFTELCEGSDETEGRCVIEKEIKPGDSDNAYKTALEALYEKGAKAVFMSNEGVVKQVYDAVNSSGGKYDDMEFCGFDAGSKQIEWMKNDDGPDLLGAVAQDSYEIGYQAVLQVINAIEGNTVTEKVDISGAWWDEDNLDEMIKKKLVYEG